MKRSTLPTIRNPVLALPAAGRLAELPPEARTALREVLLDVSGHARDRAEHSWRRRKAPMACYWQFVAVYARHIARACR